MLNNYVVGSQKLTLFVDNIGLERQSSEIVEKILKEHSIRFKTFPECDFTELKNKDEDFQLNFNEKTSVILMPISKLALKYKIPAIFELVHKLKNYKNVKQIFAWITVKNISNHLLLPFLEHVSDTIITLDSKQLLTVIVKKSSGSVKTKKYNHEILNNSFAIKEFKPEVKAVEEEPVVDPQTIGTFKIGQFKADELEAKKSLQLPFEYHRTQNQEGQILYTPDLADDLDDEDPDDDLLV